MDSKKKLTELLKNKYPKNVYVDIFSILKGEDYVANGNGIFFDLNKIEEDTINRCIDYIECIQFNIEDHLEKMTIRETLEDEFKKCLVNKPVKKEKKIQKRQKVEKPIKNPFEKRVHKGVYNRLDRVLRGVKKEEKSLKKTKKIIKEEEEQEEMKEFEEGYSDGVSEDEEDIEDDDLFGEESEDEESSIL